MSTDAYDDILKRAQNEFTAEQQRRLVDKLSQHTACKDGGAQHSITDLKGLGKEIWQGIDADQYVASERDSWDGGLGPKPLAQKRKTRSDPATPRSNPAPPAPPRGSKAPSDCDVEVRSVGNVARLPRYACAPVLKTACFFTKFSKSWCPTPFRRWADCLVCHRFLAAFVSVFLGMSGSVIP